MVIQTLLGPGWPGFLRCRWTFPDGVTSGVLLDALRPFTLGVLSSFSRICKTQIIGQISIVPNRERICLIFPEKTWIPSTVASIFQDSWSQEPTNAGMIQVCLFFFPDVSCPGLRMNRTSWRERNSSISVWCAPFATSIRGTLGSFWVHLKPPPDGQRRQRMLRKVREATIFCLYLMLLKLVKMGFCRGLSHKLTVVNPRILASIWTIAQIVITMEHGSVCHSWGPAAVTAARRAMLMCDAVVIGLAMSVLQFVTGQLCFCPLRRS